MIPSTNSLSTKRRGNTTQMREEKSELLLKIVDVSMESSYSIIVSENLPLVIDGLHNREDDSGGDQYLQ